LSFGLDEDNSVLTGQKVGGLPGIHFVTDDDAAKK
jgi:hypothetical protein